MSAQVVEISSVNVTPNSPSQAYTHTDDHNNYLRTYVSQSCRSCARPQLVDLHEIYLGLKIIKSAIFALVEFASSENSASHFFLIKSRSFGM